MKFTTKGIGWLIFGAIVCFSVTETDGYLEALSTILLGLVFVAVYAIKQIFDPAGIGWFITGGVLLAFAVELGEEPDISNLMITLVLAAIFLGIFYHKNREVIDAVSGGYDVTDEENYGAYGGYDGTDGSAYYRGAPEVSPYEQPEKREETVEFDVELTDNTDKK